MSSFVLLLSFKMREKIIRKFRSLLDFALHQRTQQENRKKPSADTDTDTVADIDESLDELLDEDQLTTTVKTVTKPANSKSSSKSKSKNREDMNFYLHSSFFKRTLYFR